MINYLRNKRKALEEEKQELIEEIATIDVKVDVIDELIDELLEDEDEDDLEPVEGENKQEL